MSASNAFTPKPVAPELNGDHPIEFRDIDLTVADAELRLRLPEVEAALARLEEAQVITQETLEFEFNI